MKESDKLYDLIHSLSQGEKGYFTKYVKVYSGKTIPNYFKLYKRLESMKEYDTQLLEKSFKGTSILKNLSKTKNELNSKLLESLATFQFSNKEKLSQIMLLLPILFERKQMKEFAIQLKAARKLATKAEDLESLIKVIDWEIAHVKYLDRKNRSEKIEVLVEDKYKHIEVLGYALELKNIRHVVDSILLVDIGVSLPESKSKFDALIDKDILKIDPVILLNSAKKDFYFVMTFLSRYKKNMQLAAEHALTLVKTHENGKSIDKVKYKEALCASLVICNHLSDKSHAIALFDKVETLLKQPGSEIDINSFNTLHFLGLRHYLLLGKLNKAIELIKSIENKWELLCKAVQIKRQIAYCSNIILVYWFSDYLESAKFWLIRLITDYESSLMSRDMMRSSRIYQLAIYYDLDIIECERQFDSTRKLLNQDDNELEKYIKYYFGKLLKSKKDNKSDIFELFYIDLLKLFTNEETKAQKSLYEMTLWVYSKYKNISLTEVRERTQEIFD